MCQWRHHLFVLEFLFGQVLAFSSGLLSLQCDFEFSQRLLLSTGSRLVYGTLGFGKTKTRTSL